MTLHAERRLAQRALKVEELIIVAGIGNAIEQHGGTSLAIVPKAEKSKWVRVMKEALGLIDTLTELNRQDRKRVRKVLSRTIERLSAKHQPYFVRNDEENSVITCGHYTARRLKQKH